MLREVEKKYKIFKNFSDIDKLIKISNEKWERENQEQVDFVWQSYKMDHDLDAFLSTYDRNKPSDTKLLDLGTCNGSQAIHAAEKGFNVVGSDVSYTALDKIRYNSKLPVKFVLDDILKTKFKDNEFDIIHDRGCFHSLITWGLSLYIKNILKILKPNGFLLLKVVSSKQKKYMGMDKILGRIVPQPYRFTPEQLVEIFKNDFYISLICPTFLESDYIEKNSGEFIQSHFLILQPR